MFGGVLRGNTAPIMSLNLSTASIRSILALSEKRDDLLSEIQKIDEQLSKAFDGGSYVGNGKVAATGHKTGNGRKRGRPSKVSVQAPTTTGKTRKRGAVKELILAGLKEAGEAGIAVKHLAVKLGLKPQNIHVWLHTTGKKGGLIKALGNGVYRLEESFGAETPQNLLEAPKPKLTRKAPKIAPKPKAKKKD